MELTPDNYQEALERQDVVAFLMAADKNRYEGLLQDLENEYLKEQDNYPRNLNQAYSLLVNWKPPTYVRGTPAGTHDGVVFAQGIQGHNATAPGNADNGQAICRYCKESMTVENSPLNSLANVPLVILPMPQEPNCWQLD
jgi:hypothetical protein